jgi:hypothetical protein
MSFELEPITKNDLIPDGRNAGGGGSLIYCAYASDVLQWPALTSEEDVTYATALVMKHGKSLIPIYGTPNTVGLNSPDQGELDGISQKPELKFFMPGNSPKLRKFMKFTNNRDMIFLFQDAEQRWFMLGTKQWPAVKNPSEGHSTGETTEKRKGAMMSFVQIANHGPVPQIPVNLIPFPSTSGSGS